LSTRFFTSWVRRGAAAAIIETDPGSGPFSGPAMFQPAVTLSLDGTSQPAIPGPDLTVLGPEAVVGLSSSAVVRTDPSNGARGVEDNYLPLVELSRADLPWMFTPAKFNGQNRLRPWMVLIAVDSSTTQLQPGSPLKTIAVNDNDLPDLNDSWAWAHAQVTVDSTDATVAANELVPASGTSAVSRFLCPRRLQADTSYLACLVPATLPGLQAGLGLPVDPGPAIAPAWTAGAGQDVVLPVYHSWRFSTGADGDFKSLVQLLQGTPADGIPGFATQTIDMSAPWQTPPEPGAGMTISLQGALSGGAEVAPTLTGQALADFQTRLTNVLNFPASLNPTAADPTLSAVAPPIYGSRHAGVTTVPTTAGWLQTLNLDPERRIAAAFGTRYVQENQEFLMQQAWNQLGAVQEANRLHALTELAATVADRLHVRHFQNFTPSQLFAVAALARTRVLVAPASTLQASTAATPLAPGTVTVAFSRFARPLGPIGIRAFNRIAPTVIANGISGAVTVTRPPLQLDGITTLMAPPPIAVGATGSTIGLGWQSVTTIEKNIPPVVDLTGLRLGVNQGVKPITGIGLDPGRPIKIFFPPPPVPVATPSLADTLTAALQPSIGIYKRYGGRVSIPPQLNSPGLPSNIPTRVMAYPQFTAPLALALIKSHLNWIVPGLGNFPDNSVTLLETNGAFVEAFLVGANHEMNRLLLWREYPTDQRGTPFQYFWPRPDRSPDIPPITTWDIATPLGNNSNGPGPEDMIVFLVRGEVLHRYPQTIVYAVPGVADGLSLTLDTDITQWVSPLFLMKIDPRTTAFAYQLSKQDVQGSPGFYFVFSEPVTGPRFNFDVDPTPDPLTKWNDLGWDEVSLATDRGFAVAGRDLANTPPLGLGDPRWNNDSADIARIAFAQPYRVGYHAQQLIGSL
jgi:hypothetical protein